MPSLEYQPNERKEIPRDDATPVAATTHPSRAHLTYRLTRRHGEVFEAPSRHRPRIASCGVPKGFYPISTLEQVFL